MTVEIVPAVAVAESYLVTLDTAHHDTARHQGWPTEPFYADLAPGEATVQFWHRLTNRATGQVLDLPPMYRLIPLIVLTTPR